jgi:hypothetical protein
MRLRRILPLLLLLATFLPTAPSIAAEPDIEQLFPPYGAKVPNPTVRPPKPAWAADYALFDEYPLALPYLVENRQFHGGTLLLVGSRPPGDNASSGRTRFGGVPASRWWMFEDEKAALPVTGLAPPPPGRRIALAAKFEGAGDNLVLVGLRVVALGSTRGTTVVAPGDFVLLPTHFTKSTSELIEFSGDTEAIEVLPMLNATVVRAVRPGTVNGKVLVQWWNRPDPEPEGEFKLVVGSRE